MASPELETILEMLKSSRLGQTPTVAEQREAMDAFARPAGPDVQVDPVSANGVPAEWLSIEGVQAERTILYLHGGGYVIGSIKSHREMVSRLARAAEARALLIDYRLAPEHKCPAAVEDAVAAYRFLREQGVAAREIVIAGDSAGGGLTVATLIALRDAGDELPAAAICISPWVDLCAEGESMTTKAAVDPMVQKRGLLEMARHYAGDDLRNPLASPLYGDLHGLPPILVQVGTSETLLDDSTRLAARAKAAGVDVTLEPWEDMFHVWHMFAGMLPEGQQAIERIGEYIRAHTPGPVGAGV